MIEKEEEDLNKSIESFHNSFVQNETVSEDLELSAIVSPETKNQLLLQRVDEEMVSIIYSFI